MLDMLQNWFEKCEMNVILTCGCLTIISKRFVPYIEYSIVLK